MDIEKLKKTKDYKDAVKQLKEYINTYESVKRLSAKRLRYNIYSDCITITYIGNCYDYTSKSIMFNN